MKSKKKPQEDFKPDLKSGPLQFLAQVENKFILATQMVADNEKALFGIDQHALHERVNLELLETLYFQNPS